VVHEADAVADAETRLWKLQSAEKSHRRSPNTFFIPSHEARSNLRRGQAPKLIFDIEGTNEDGSVVVSGERMWVS
jgi:hypothetical protein